jgi:hypothetical protein
MKVYKRACVIGLATRIGACGLATLSAVATMSPANLNAQAVGACAGVAGCAQVRNFVATVSDMRFSMAGPVRVVTATLRFENRSTKPLILGYVQNSGVATDDRGNRYALNGASAVRGIGQIASSTFDPKFVLQPGESSDARFEFTWRPDSHVIYGTAYDLELAIREINPVTATQLRLGSEFALHFASLTPPFAAGMPAVAQSTPTQTGTAVTSTQPAPITSAVANACGSTAHCYSAGPFTATVTSLSSAPSGRHRAMEVRVRFRNMTSQPLILAYTARSGAGVDNLNNRYYWGHAGSRDASVQGIGIVQGTSADPQFTLQPGESRDATFHAIWYDGANKGAGSSYAYDFSVEQLQVLPSQQVQSLRQYALHFDNLAAGTMSGVPAQTIGEAVNRLRGLIHGRKP